MAKLGISTGISPDDGQGDSLLVAGAKINQNFNEIYNLCGSGTTLAPGIVTSLLAGTNISLSGSTGQITVTSTAAGGVWQETGAGINTVANVGFGTTNPQTALQVGTAISFTNTYSQFKDGIVARYGDAADLTIQHNGTNSIIKSDTNDLQFHTDELRILDNAASETIAVFSKDGAATFYYDDTAKFRTTGAGTSTIGISSASGGFVGALTGNVTGNLEGTINSTAISGFGGTITRFKTTNVDGSLGISTFGTVAISTDFTVGQDATITRNLKVSGITTFSGITTTGTDAFVARNMAVLGFMTATTFSGPQGGNLQVYHGTGGGASKIVEVTGTGVTMTSGKKLHLSGYSEQVHDMGTLSAGSHALDVSTYSTFVASINGTTGITFTLTGQNPARTYSGVLVLKFTGTGTRSITFSFAPKWSGGSAPTWTATAATDIVSFFTPDNATNTYFNVLGLGYA